MDANSASAKLGLAESHFAAGRLSDAEPLFRRVLGVSGDDARVLHFLGYIARQNGNLTGAIESYAAAVMPEPDNGQLPHNNLAEARVCSATTRRQSQATAARPHSPLTKP